LVYLPAAIRGCRRLVFEGQVGGVSPLGQGLLIWKLACVNRVGAAGGGQPKGSKEIRYGKTETDLVRSALGLQSAIVVADAAHPEPRVAGPDGVGHCDRSGNADHWA
jgi:hypothetical protein